MTLFRKLRTARRVFAQFGLGGLASAVAASLQPRDFSADVSFVEDGPFGADAADLPARTINWVIPPFGIGSGGHINIFRLVLNLETIGFTSVIHIMGSSGYSSPEAAQAAIRKHFFPLKAQVVFGVQSMQPASITVATSWQTAYPVRNFRGSARKVYFIQDFEPDFYPRGSAYVLAEDTYRFGFTGVTAGEWLQTKLAAEYGMTTHAMGFSYDRALYRRSPRPDADRPRVFFYARPPTARRAFELGMLALGRLADAMPEVDIVLAGWDLGGAQVRFPHRSLGNVALDRLGELYGQCDAALVLSMTNLSLLPLELMACGCVVVSNRGANTEWLLNDDNAVLADANPGALCEALQALLTDPQRRARLAEAGATFAAATDWQVEADRVAAVFQSLDPAR